MEKKIVICFYKEHSTAGDFTDQNPPFVKSDQAKEFKTSNYRAFKECGGVSIVDYYFDTKTHIRVSFWTTPEDYNKWVHHPKTAEYLLFRKEHHHRNNISESFEGPFEASQHD